MKTSDDVVLNDRQARFVNEYLIDLNATQAAIRSGYSEKTAYSIGSENLRKPEIQKAIAAAQADLKARTLVTQEDVIKGFLSEAKEFGEGASHSARVSAWAHLGKHLNMFVDKVDHTTNGKEIKSGLGHFYGRGNDDGDSDT
jgi:phage terminase small subunit